MIESDKTHVSRIFSNLIDNANKYSKGSPLIKISMYEVTKGIIVDVADNGIGIGKKHQEQIFKTLYRVPTNNIHDIKGFGLGLSYVKSMLKHLGGKISLDSEIGKGTCFHIFLPKNN
jgi:two-component system phosphate regulon sensor histidine kinase PhoR